MKSPFAIERLATAALSPAALEEVLRLNVEAFHEPIAPYLEAIGPGEHLLGRVDGRLVSHLMWVTRWLQPEGFPLLRTAYVELVATDPADRGHGYATQLLTALPPLIGDYQLAALSPATERLYTRLGWRYWRGPLAVRTDQGLEPTSDESVMFLPLPLTPPLDPNSPLSVEWRSGEVW